MRFEPRTQVRLDACGVCSIVCADERMRCRTGCAAELDVLSTTIKPVGIANATAFLYVCLCAMCGSDKNGTSAPYLESTSFHWREAGGIEKNNRYISH